MIYCFFVAAYFCMQKVVQGLKTFSYFGLILLFGATFLSFFGSASYLLDLLTHFHLQYAIGFLVLVGFFLVQKKPFILFVATLGFITHIIFLLPYYFQPTALAINTSETTTLRVFFNNINYGIIDYSLLIDSIHQHQPQVIGLVEISGDKYNQLKAQLLEYPFSYHVPGRGKQGLALFSQLPFADQPSTQYFSDNQFPSIVATIQALQSDKQLTIIVIHPPPPIISNYTTARNTLFDNLADFASLHTGPLLVVGDFNSTGWSPAFQKLLADSVLIDSRNNQGVQPSWPSQLPKFLRIPIDHMLTNQQVIVSHREVLPSIGSDHLPVLADFSW